MDDDRRGLKDSPFSPFPLPLFLISRWNFFPFPLLFLLRFAAPTGEEKSKKTSTPFFFSFHSPSSSSPLEDEGFKEYI